MKEQCLNIYIFGRVQGVFYQKTIQKYAKKLSITGYIENNDNGSVYIRAYGSRKILKKILKLCKKGSLFSRVENLHIQWSNTIKNKSTSFIIIKHYSFLRDQINNFCNLIKIKYEHKKNKTTTRRHYSKWK